MNKSFDDRLNEGNDNDSIENSANNIENVISNESDKSENCSLICPECHTEYSDNINQCSKCGYIFSKENYDDKEESDTKDIENNVLEEENSEEKSSEKEKKSAVKDKKNKYLNLKILLGIVSALFIILLVININAKELMKGCFDINTATPAGVANLRYYAPAGWSVHKENDQVVDGSLYNAYATYQVKDKKVATLYIKYYGEIDEKDILKTVKKDFTSHDSDYTSITVSGCTEAYKIHSYVNSNNELFTGRVLYLKNRLFVIYGVATKKNFDEKEFENIFNACDTLDFHPIELCANKSCMNKPIEGYKYCKDHTCLTPGCYAGAESDTRFCTEHEQCTYSYTEDVPDFDAISGIDEDSYESELLASLTDGEAGAYVYYFEDNKQNNEIFEAYEQLLFSKGFKKKGDLKNTATYINDTSRMAILLTECVEEDNRGDMILMIIYS